jgi:hypothetical protein
MLLAVEIAPILLHLSVCLFFGGLVIIFHTINTKVAIAVDVAVGIFLPHTVITALPFRNPFLDVTSGARWRISQVVILRSPSSSGFLALWMMLFSKPPIKYCQWFWAASSSEGIQSSMRSRRNIEQHKVGESRESGHPSTCYLIPFIESGSGRVVLREPLLALLRTYAAGTPAAAPDGDERKRSLLVYLDAIHPIDKHQEKRHLVMRH